MEWEGAFAVHSANLPEHEYKRWGEIDFLVVTPSGLIAIEVKGGTVDYVDRVWRYANGRGRAIESTESPAAQCQSAVRALERQLDKRLDLDLAAHGAWLFRSANSTGSLRNCRGPAWPTSPSVETPTRSKLGSET
jgi:hypothetical protein